MRGAIVATIKQARLRRISRLIRHAENEVLDRLMLLPFPKLGDHRGRGPVVDRFATDRRASRGSVVVSASRKRRSNAARHARQYVVSASK